MLIIIATTQSIKAGMNILKRLNVKPNRFLSQQFWFLQFWLLPFAIWQARIVIFKLSEVKTKKPDLETFNVDYQGKINFGQWVPEAGKNQLRRVGPSKATLQL